MNKVLIGDVIEKLKEIPDGSVQCVVTSPPYWGLRDYGVEGQMGLEKTPEEYVAKMVEVFREVRRTLKDDGTLWLNLGDSYASSSKRSGGPTKKQTSIMGSFFSVRHLDHGLKEKDLVGIPWRVAFAIQADGWYLRQEIIWAKGNPMPESVTDRFTKSHEKIFLLTKSPRYFFDAKSVKEPSVYPGPRRSGKHRYAEENGHGQRPHTKLRHVITGDTRNRRDVWKINTKPFRGAHFAVFPEAIPEICIKAGSKEGDTVLDPFAGSGTTLAVAKRLGRNYLGIELNEKYLPLIEERLSKVIPPL